MSTKNIDDGKLYTLAEAIAHTDQTIELAGNRLQQKAQAYSLSRTRSENDPVSRK